MTEAAALHDDVSDAPPGGRAFWLATSDGLRLRAAVWDGGDRGTVVVFPGRTEFIEKYGRVVGRLQARGFSVAVIDWRGQGLSQRREIHPHLGHVEDFRHYQRDVEALLAHPLVAGLPGPRHMLAHSMGACIGLRTLLERSDFAAAILSAPMWHLQMKTAVRELTSRVTQLAGAFGLGHRLTPGTSDRPTPLAVGFELNALTSDPDQFAWCLAQISGHPELALAGPNMHWTRAAIEEMSRLYIAPLPRLPVLTFLGSDEQVVSSKVVRAQMAKMPQGRLVELPGARHEIFMERPEILARVWEEIDAFLGLAPPLEAERTLLGEAGAS
jgi:lysophospholipase